MVEPGLSQRLRRHSRNSGMMIGVSMAAAMIVCIAAFIWLYVQVGPLLSDFIPQGTPESEEQLGTGSIVGDTDGTPTPSTSEADDFTLAEIPPEPVGTPDPAADDDDDAADDADDAELVETDDEVDDNDNGDDVDEAEWEATHEIRDGPNVNFRSGPNTISQSQGSLPPGSPLLFLDDEEPSEGVVWMYFETEDGTEGWIRDIDVIEHDEADDGE